MLDDAPGVADGTVTLEYVASTHSLRAVAGGSYGAYVAVAADGRVAIPAGEGYLFATVTSASLPGTNQSDTLTVAALANALFDDIGKAESYNGDTEYRCCYLHNAHPTDAFLGTQVYIASQPTGADALAIGLDGAGIGNGATTGVAATVADESTAPAVTFAQPASH